MNTAALYADIRNAILARHTDDEPVQHRYRLFVNADDWAVLRTHDASGRALQTPKGSTLEVLGRELDTAAVGQVYGVETFTDPALQRGQIRMDEIA